jgi:hypothetical protein
MANGERLYKQGRGQTGATATGSSNDMGRVGIVVSQALPLTFRPKSGLNQHRLQPAASCSDVDSGTQPRVNESAFKPSSVIFDYFSAKTQCSTSSTR